MAINAVIDSRNLIKKSTYSSANSVLVQKTGTATPEILPISEDTILGRKTGGTVGALTVSEVKTMLNTQISDVSGLQTALDNKQASGDYATNTALTEGLATKQPTGDYATNTALTNGLATKQNTIAPLMPYDYWYETRFLNTNIVQPHLLGTAIASGTSTTAVPVLSSNTLYPYGIFLRSSTSANGGFRFQSVLINTDFFGGVAHKFQTAIMWKTSFTGRTLRIGYHDTQNQVDATDGAYFEILDNVVNCKTANNSSRSTVTMVATLSLDVVYVFDIESNTNGTQIIYKLINGTTSETIESRTITTNIPNTSARGFGVGVVATELSTTASDICVVYYIGNGTLNAFNRQRN